MSWPNVLVPILSRQPPVRCGALDPPSGGGPPAWASGYVQRSPQCAGRGGGRWSPNDWPFSSLVVPHLCSTSAAASAPEVRPRRPPALYAGWARRPRRPRSLRPCRRVYPEGTLTTSSPSSCLRPRSCSERWIGRIAEPRRSTRSCTSPWRAPLTSFEPTVVPYSWLASRRGALCCCPPGIVGLAARRDRGRPTLVSTPPPSGVEPAGVRGCPACAPASGAGCALPLG